MLIKEAFGSHSIKGYLTCTAPRSTVYKIIHF